MTYQNPILTGMYPDPSICRVHEDYYLVTSSFEYLPGIPVFHSKDLIHWRQIGHALQHEGQMEFPNAKSSKGIWAPTIRFHDGMFYIASTVADGNQSRNFYVTACDPEGPWSAPVYVEQSGVDPSLFFDDDGSVYFTSNRFGDGLPNAVVQQSLIDVSTGKLRSEPRIISEGSGGAFTEAPHLFKRNGRYYLVCAEGGTGLSHMSTLFRADTPWGPFEGCPFNPVLTSRDAPQPALCAMGHADFVTDQQGNDWAVFLCHRNTISKYHTLGRETALLPVCWREDGWPEVLYQQAPLRVECQTLLSDHPWPREPARDIFTESGLGHKWNFLRMFIKDYAMEAEGLSLLGNAFSLSDCASPAFIAQRQRHFDCEIKTKMMFEPRSENEEAGVAVRMSEQAFYCLTVTRRDGRKCLALTKRLGDMQTETVCPVEYGGPLELYVQADRERYTFGHMVNGERCALGSGLAWMLSSEVHLGFTGVYLGMYASGNGTPCISPARYSWFEYNA